MKFSIQVLLTILLIAALPHAAGSAPVDGDADALTAATHDLCHRQVAMLGESATHGDGHTEAFKVALVERLVNECGFDSVFFEASHYEFLHIARRLRIGQAVSGEQLSAAIGGLWEFDREFQPLVPFLLSKVQAGQISLGGIDDQLGELGQDYANVEMVAELAVLLPQPRRQDCSLALHHRIYSDFDHPYSASDHAQIATCLLDMRLAAAADKAADPAARDDQQEMISSAQRWISRDFASSGDQIVERDRSMFQNFEWLRRQRPLRHKVIVWAATVHIAKQADPTWADHSGENFGSHVHREYGADAFSLGFSALAGSYRQGRRDIKQQPAAPPDSVEAHAMQASASDAVYVGPAQLAAIGTAPGAIFRHSYQPLAWASFVDGVVVFREERPPTSTR